MYKIGDRIVYPMHGAGEIEGIEEKTVMGELRRYYILKVPFGDMRIMIPCQSGVNEEENCGIRNIIDRRELKGVEKSLKKDSTEMNGNWNRRFRENTEKLKTGELSDVCEVVRNLMRADKIKKLSTGEKKMLSNARQILISELILVSDKNEDEINIYIDKLVFG
jgi:CarD family transcriptional regulator